MNRAKKTLILWGVLIAIFLGIWQFLSPSAPAHVEPRAPEASSTGSYVAVAALLVAVVVLFRAQSKFGKRTQDAVQRHAAAIANEDFEAAAAAIGDLPTWPRVNAISRASGRAFALYLDGRFTDGLAAVEPAIDCGLGVLFRRTARDNERIAIGRRAVLRAATDDVTGARADLARLVSSPNLAGTARSLAAFAEVVMAARAEDADELREVLDRNAVALRGGLSSREMTVVQAAARKVSRASPGAYRSIPTDPSLVEAGSPALAAWAAKLAPSVAPFVASLRAKTDLPDLAAPSEDARQLASGVRSPARAPASPYSAFGMRPALFATIGGGAFASIAVADALLPREYAGYRSAVPLAAVVPIVVLLMRRAAADGDVERRAQDLLAAGSPDEATPLAEMLASRAEDGKVLAGHRLLATIALFRGERARALEECDVAIACAARAELKARRASAPRGKPVEFERFATAHADLAALRAQILTTLGRDDEAAAELALVPQPSATLRYVVRLLQLARGDDPGEGARFAARRGLDLDFVRSYEVLGDVLLGAAGDAVAARDVERALHATPSLTRWLEAVAPKAFARLRSGDATP